MRIFVSAVTNEFGEARDAVASDLRARGHEVKLQSDFTQGGDAEFLLERLHDYIRDCNAASRDRIRAAAPDALGGVNCHGILPSS